MRKLKIALIFTLLWGVSYAQQDPQFSLNMYNMLAINPGYAGCNGAVCGTMLHRNQWLGFGDGRPVTYVGSIHGEIKSINSGVGLSIMQDEIGAETNMWMTLNYAYRLKLGDGMLGLGLSLGFINKAIDGDWTTPGMLDGTINNPYEDPIVPYSESKIAFDAGFGAYYRTNDLYVGISSTHLPETKYKFSGTELSYMKRHYYLAAGYFYELPNRLFVVKPGIFIKSDGATTQYDINAILEYKRMAWGGITYRIGDAFVPMVGVTLPIRLDIGIAYDFTTSDVGAYNDGTIEIMARYCFNLKMDKQTGSYKSVRYL
ncbi:MAG: hypothetical protein C0594_10110 [Marinilabiliales bacterium]|nr:MAG: hypothetical protein C0594_10110 [Marinilabiliales bacterium]